MKLASALVAAFLSGVLATSPGHAQPACGPDALGVSRVVEINASGGQLFGQQQYKDNDFLAPGEVVLTFDDGPLRAYTVPVIKALEAHCTRATFFMVGKMAVSDPELVRDIARRGHTVGTHTWSHQHPLGRTNFAKAREEIELGLSAVQKSLGQPVAPFFRFPFLSDSRAAISHLASRDHAVFSIDVDSLDYRFKGPGGAGEMVRKTMRDLNARGKGILLFHDIQPATARGLPDLLAQLKQKGYRIVHVTAKGKAQTLAEFDAMADRVADKKKLAAASNPLAPRTLTWQMGTTASPDPVPVSAAGYPAAKPLPWQQAPPPQGWNAPTAPQPSAAMNPEPPPSARRPSLRGTIDEGDWRTRVFN